MGFLNKLGSLLRSLVQDIYLETACAPKDDLITCGAGMISITGTIAAGYNPFVTTTGGATYGTTVDPKEIGGIYNRDGEKIGSIRKESRTNISRVERNAEKVYSNFHKDLMKTSTPIIMADDPATYDAMDVFLKARSSGMLLRMLNVLDTVLSNDEDDTLSQ